MRWAQLVGEEGRGVPTIVEMVVHTRLDCVLGTAAGMRQAVEQATHHAAHRIGVRLDCSPSQPLMRNVLADLCLESEAATVDRAAPRARLRPARARLAEAAFARIATAVAKYWICKRGPGARSRGARVPRRERLRRGVGAAAGLPPAAAPLDLGGAGNVVCLDVLRDAAPRAGDGARCSSAEIRLAGEPALTALAEDALAGAEEGQARAVVERLALALQASLLVRHAPPAVADAFLSSRLGRQGLGYGALGSEVDSASIVERHTPIGELDI